MTDTEGSIDPIILSDAIRILGPLVEKASRNGFNDNDCEAHLMALVGSLKRAGRRAQEILGLGNDDPGNNALLASLAPLVAEHGDDVIVQGVDQILEAASAFFADLPDLPDTDIAALGVGIKKALFGPTTKICKTLDLIGMEFEQARGQMRMIVETAVHLSAVLAFQWAKKSGLDDGREQLFINALGPVLALTEQAWADSATTEISQGQWSPGGSPAERFPQLTEEVSQLDMGWAGAMGGTPELMSQLAQRLENRILWTVPDSWLRSMRERLAGALCAALDARAAEAWRMACDRLSDEVTAMDDEAMADFLKGEGAEPMRITRFEAALASMDGEPLLDGLEADPDEMVRLARKRLAVLWGVSDAACQTHWL